MINTWNESMLHEQLKTYYAEPSSTLEAELDGSICDILNEDGSIVEIQTGNFGNIKKKLEKLLTSHRVSLVYPIAATKKIITKNTDGTQKSSRKSPKKGTYLLVFKELTAIVHLIAHPNLRIILCMIDSEEIRIADGTGSWRRKGIRIDDKRMLSFIDSYSIETLKDLAALIPETIPDEFTTKDLAEIKGFPYAGHMAWVLHKTGITERIGKSGRYWQYRRR